MNLQQQIAAIKKAIGDKQTEIVTISGQAISKGLTADETQESQITAIEDDIAVLQKNLDRLEAIAKAQNITATPVAGENEEQAIKSATGNPDPANIQVQSNLPPGVGLAMVVRSKLVSVNLAKTQGEYINSSDLLKSWSAPQHVQNVAKAVAGTTTSTQYAALMDTQNLVNEFLDLMRPHTIIDQMQGFRRVPFNTRVVTKTSGSIVNWVGEGQKKPVTNLVLGQTSLGFSKIAGIVPFSDELSRFSNPNSDLMVRDDLRDSIVEFMNAQFIDPTKAETTDSPASVLHNAPKIVASGITAAAIQADLRKLRGTFIANNVSLTGAYYVMSETMASYLADLTDALGNPVYKGLDAPVGQKTLKGLPVVESEGAGMIIALIKPSQILLADDGGVDLAVSTEATLSYNNGTADVDLHLFQQNMIAIRAERYVRWKPRHANAAAYVDYSAETIE